MTRSAAAPVDFADITQLIAAAHTQAGLRGFTRANLFRMRPDGRYTLLVGGQVCA